MDDDISVLFGIANSLLSTTLDAYKFRHFDYYDHVYKEVNKLTNKLHSRFSETYEFSELGPRYSPGAESLLEVISVLRQLVALLRSVLGSDEEDTDLLREQVNRLEAELVDLKKKEDRYIEIIHSSRARSGYIVEPDKLSRFQGKNLNLINEALDAFSVGAYTACVCVCRNILQDLVQSLCQVNLISEGSLTSQITALVSKNVIKTSHHSLLIELSKIFGNRAAHPTTEQFDRTKANLVLSALFIVNEELFTCVNDK